MAFTGDGGQFGTVITSGGFNLVKAGAGRVWSLSIVASGAAGSINDTASSGVVAGGNTVLTIPASAAAGTIYNFYGGYPIGVGIGVTVGAGAIYALCYS